MLRILAILAAALGIATGVTGCDPGSGMTGPPERTLLRRGNGGDPGTLDPALAEDVHAFNVLADLYEGLLTPAADGRPVAGVARAWEVSEDGLVYTFRLRDDARWSNGDPLTAADFLRGLRHRAAPGTRSGYAELLDAIDNFDAVRSGRRAPDALGVSAPDAHTLIVRLSRPVPYLPSILAMPVGYPMHATHAAPGAYSDAQRFVGNGAYVLTELEAGGLIRLEKNPRFHAADTVAVDVVEYYPTPDLEAELARYRAGELDLTASIPPASLGRLRGTIPDEIRIAPLLALYYLAFDLTEAPLDDAHLRHALSLAIDRGQLAALLGRGELPAFGIVPPGVANHDGAQYDWRDAAARERLAAARDRLAQAGYGTDRPLKLKLLYDTGDIHERVALIVADMWREALGAEVELEKREWQYFLATRDDRSDWQVMRFAWFGDYDDATTFLDIFRSGSPQNLPRFEDAAYDELLERAAQQADTALRAGLLHAAERRLLEAAPVAPLYFYVSKHLVKPYVTGFEDNLLDRHPSRYLAIDGR